MTNSKEWWNQVKNDPVRLLDWLKKQYHGEVTAAERIRAFMDSYGHQATNHELEILTEIVKQEEKHAEWIGELLTSRGEAAELIENKESRYWDKTLPGITRWSTGCAVGAHAESMRLERIRVICKDSETPADIRKVFVKILPQEEFHARSFRMFSTAAALDKTIENHISGKNALGLSA